MIETYFVGAYWGSRYEMLSACTDRTTALLTGLSQVDPVMGDWTAKIKVKGRKTQQVHLPEDRAVLEQRLFEGRYREGLEPVEKEMGFGVVTWNKLSRIDRVFLMLRIGGYGRYAHNYCTLELPYGEPYTGRLLNVEKLIALIEPMVTHLGPDSGRISPSGLGIHAAVKEAGAQAVGWLTYLAVDPSRLPRLPSPARAVPLGKGSLIIATDERFTMSNPDHIDLVIQIYRTLKEAGLPVEFGKRPDPQSQEESPTVPDDPLVEELEKKVRMRRWEGHVKVDRKVRDRMKRQLKKFLQEKIDSFEWAGTELKGDTWTVTFLAQHVFGDDLNTPTLELEDARQAVIQREFKAVQDVVTALGGTCEWDPFQSKSMKEPHVYTVPAAPASFCLPEEWIQDEHGHRVKVRDARALAPDEIDSLIANAEQKDPKGALVKQLREERKALHYYKFVGGSETAWKCWEKTRIWAVSLFLQLTLPANVVESPARPSSEEQTGL